MTQGNHGGVCSGHSYNLHSEPTVRRKDHGKQSQLEKDMQWGHPPNKGLAQRLGFLTLLTVWTKMWKKKKPTTEAWPAFPRPIQGPTI